LLIITFLQPRTEEEQKKASKRLLKRQRERKLKLEKAGIKYDFDAAGYVSNVVKYFFFHLMLINFIENVSPSASLTKPLVYMSPIRSLPMLLMVPFVFITTPLFHEMKCKHFHILFILPTLPVLQESVLQLLHHLQLERA
jgi:hypothetical protein